MQAIEEFTKTESALAQLEVDYKEVPDASTTDGYLACTQALSVLRPLRTGIDKSRKRLNEDDQNRIKYRNSEAKRITTRLKALEDPIKQAKSLVDQEKERIENEKRQVEVDRIESHKAAIIAIQTIYPADMIHKISDQIKEIDKYDPQTLEEFSVQAQAEIKLKREQLVNAKDHLIDLQDQKEENDRIAKQQAKDQAAIDKQNAKIKKEQDRKQADIDKREQALKAQQDAIEAKKREEQERLLQAQRAEAEAIRLENERLQKIKDDKKAEDERLEKEKLEAQRIEQLKPDLEKIRDWCEMIKNIDAPEVKDKDLLGHVKMTIVGINESVDDLLCITNYQ